MRPPANDVEARLNPWLLALVLPIAGFVFGVYVGAAIHLAGTPGAALSRRLLDQTTSRFAFAWAVVLIGLGQLAVSLLWVVVLFLSVAHLLDGRGGVGKYIAWALALGAAAVPAQTVTSLYTLSGAEQVATVLTLRLTTLVAVVLLFVPQRLERALGWMPSLRTRTATALTAPRLPTQMEGARDSMAAALTHFNAADDLRTGRDHASRAAAQGDSLVRFHLREGLRAASFVTPAFLDWMRPGMRVAFEDEYVAGQDSFYRGLLQDDVALQRQGDTLIALWIEGYWKVHRDSLFVRAYR